MRGTTMKKWCLAVMLLVSYAVAPASSSCPAGKLDSHNRAKSVPARTLVCPGSACQQKQRQGSPGQHQAELVFRLPVHKHKLFKSSIVLARVRRARTVRAISSERALDPAWRREVVKTSVRVLRSVSLLPAGKKGLTEIGISRTLTPRWNTIRWRLGRRSWFRSVGSLGRVLNGC
jgi:hypothetical protein